MSKRTIPTVEEVEAQIKAEEAKIAAAQEKRRLLMKQKRLSAEMSQITELNAENAETGTPTRIIGFHSNER